MTNWTEDEKALLMACKHLNSTDVERVFSKHAKNNQNIKPRTRAAVANYRRDHLMYKKDKAYHHQPFMVRV